MAVSKKDILKCIKNINKGFYVRDVQDVNEWCRLARILSEKERNSDSVSI